MQFFSVLAARKNPWPRMALSLHSGRALRADAQNRGACSDLSGLFRASRFA